MNRLEDNKELLKILTKLINKNPDLRFGQLLRAYNFVGDISIAFTDIDGYIISKPIGWEDEFYLESSALLERVKRRVG